MSETDQVYFDREADVVYIKPAPGVPERTVEHDWGLLEYNAAGVLVGIELWDVSKLPEPTVPDAPEAAVVLHIWQSE